MNSEFMHHPIPPVYDENSAVLILGSFPSAKSRETGFFYGHPQNRFWRVAAAVFGEETPKTVEEKKRFLIRNRIALWDVIASCGITGSSDSSIRNAYPNDLRPILEKARIRRVFVNGRTAGRLYHQLIEPETGVCCVCLPSTSPANASCGAEELANAWRAVKRAVDEAENENIKIRKIREDEIGKVGAFYDECVWALVNSVNYPHWMYKEYPSENSVRASFLESAQFLCEQEGRVVGAFVLNDDPQGAYEKGSWSKALQPGAFAVIHALAVAPEKKGRGIGRKMVEFCMEEAKKRGYAGIRLDVVPGNTPAQRLYESFGFKEAGTLDLDRGYEDIPLFTLYEYYFEENGEEP